MNQLSEKEMLHRAAAYCSSVERCADDVRKKLSTSDLSPEAIDRIIGRLVQEKFIDEERFSKSFANDKFRFNKWGRLKIRYELKQKKISENYIQPALDNLPDEAYEETLRQLLITRRKSVKGKNNQEVFQKLLRFAAGRGFETNRIIAILKELFKGEAYESDW